MAPLFRRSAAGTAALKRGHATTHRHTVAEALVGVGGAPRERAPQ